MDRNARILISGAGVAGLTAAIWLGRAGFRPLIVEKAPRIRADGFILSLSKHSYHLLQEMGILDALIAVNNRVERSSYHDRAGHAILELDYDRLFEAGNITQVMRDDLERILHDQAKDQADYLFSNSVIALAQRGDEVHVTFEDGSERQFDLVIGADGLHSAVRQCAFTDDEVTRHYLGLHAAAFRCDNHLGLSHKYEAYLEPYRHTIIYTTRTNELASIFIWADTSLDVPPPGPERLRTLSATYEGAHPNVRRLIDACNADDPLYMDVLLQIEMASWHKGRVALIGDAAHSLTLLSGQGASIAIACASALARALGEMPVHEALAHYDAVMRPIVAKAQPATRRNVRWYVPGGLGFHLLRDASMRFLPNELWVRYFKSKYSKG